MRVQLVLPEFMISQSIIVKRTFKIIQISYVCRKYPLPRVCESTKISYEEWLCLAFKFRQMPLCQVERNVKYTPKSELTFVDAVPH